MCINVEIEETFSNDSVATTFVDDVIAALLDLIEYSEISVTYYVKKERSFCNDN